MSSEKIGSYMGVEIRRFFPKDGQCPKPRTINELINSPKAYESE